jgi:hypothetical protein
MAEVIVVGGTPQPAPAEKKKGSIAGFLIVLIILLGAGVIGFLYLTQGAGGQALMSGVRKGDCRGISNSEPVNTKKKALIGFVLDRPTGSDEYDNLVFEIYDSRNNLVQSGYFTLSAQTEFSIWEDWSSMSQFYDAFPGGRVVYTYTKTTGSTYTQEDIIWSYVVFIRPDYSACIYIPERALRKR